MQLKQISDKNQAEIQTLQQTLCECQSQNQGVSLTQWMGLFNSYSYGYS